MIENFLRPPRTPGQFTADGIRFFGVLSIVIAALVFEPTDAGVLAAALPVLLLPRFVGVASWFDILYGVVVLVAAWSNVFDLYTTVPGWDIVLHFVCTGVLTVLTYLALVRADIVPAASDPRFRPRIALVLCPALGLALSVLWEMVEWFGHAVITDTISVGYADTIGDLAAGGVGAFVAGLVVVRVRLDRRAEALSSSGAPRRT
jgi:hypothetical protein